MSSSGGINWTSIYNTPIGALLQDLNPSTFFGLIGQETTMQQSQYTSQQKQDNTQMSAWTTLQSDANTVLSDLTTLGASSTYNQLSTTSSQSNVATAVDQSAQPGSYNIYVKSVAQAEIDSGSSANMTVTNPNATLTLSGGAALQGTFSIAVGGGTAVSVTMPSGGESLNALISQINTTPGMGVTASLSENSSGQYVMELQANTTGQAITYTDSPGSSGQSYGPLYYLGVVSSDGSTPGTSTLSAANVLQASSSAEVSFGTSFNSTNYVTSTSNTITNLIPGMTIKLLSTGGTTITVSPNVSSMAKSVQQFVSDWNQWASDTQNLAEAGKVVESGSGTSASYTYQSNSHQVLTSGLPMLSLNSAENVMATATNGLTSSTYQSLADIGVTLGSNGQLSLNTSTLDAALTNDPTAVQSLFTSLSSALGVGTTSGGQAANGVIANFSEGPSSTVGQAVATLNAQVSQDQSHIALLKQQLTVEENQAIKQYGQWINNVAKYSQQYSLLNALYNQNSNGSTSGG